MNHGSFFSGIGGFDLAAEWAGWNNMFHCEWNEFGRKVLNYYWPNAESYEDITKSDFTIWRGKIDILTGGFPCQGFSLAGLRKGTEDHRFLWPEMRRVYNESKPTWVVCENVTGLLTMADEREVSKDVFFKVENQTVTRLLETDLYDAIYTRQSKMLIESICQDFEEDGYEVYPFVIPAASVEAPHIRDRVWLIAYNPNARTENMQYRRENGIYEPKSTANTRSNGYESGRLKKNRSEEEKSKSVKDKREWIRDDAWRDGKQEDVTNTGGKQLQERTPERNGENKEKEGTGLDNRAERSGNIRDASDTDGNKRSERGVHKAKSKKTKRHISSCDARKIRSNWENFPTQSPICSGNDGLSGRLDGITFPKWRAESIKAYGNAIVPQVAYEIFKAINHLNAFDYENEIRIISRI